MVVLLVVGILANVAAFDGLAPSEQTVTPKAELNSYMIFPEEQQNGDNQVIEHLTGCPNTELLLRALNILTDSLAKEEQEIDINKFDYILKLLENLDHSPIKALNEEYNTVVTNVKSLIDKNLSQKKDAMRKSSRKDKKKIKITVQYEIPVSPKCEDANKQMNLIKHIAQHNIPGLENFKVIPDEVQSLMPQDNKDSEKEDQLSNLQNLLHIKSEKNAIKIPQNYRPQQYTYDVNNDNENVDDLINISDKFQYQPVNTQNQQNNDEYKPIEDNKGLQYVPGNYKTVPLAPNNVNYLPYYLMNTPERIEPSIGNKLGSLQNTNKKSQVVASYNDPETKIVYSQSPYLNPNAISLGNLLNQPNIPKSYNNLQSNGDIQDSLINKNILSQLTRPEPYNNYPISLQKLNQNVPNVFNLNNQNPILISSKNPQQKRFEFNAKSTDKNRHVPHSLNLPKTRYIQTVTNLLNGTQTNNDRLVELTYVLQAPKAVHYQPFYMVKYRLPLRVFQENLNKLLDKKPYLRYDPNRLYQELIVAANSTNTLTNIPGLKHKEVINIISKDGLLVGSKILDSNEIEMKELNTIKELNSNLSSEDILNLNNHTFDKELERLKLDNILDNSFLANIKGRGNANNNASYQEVKTVENARDIVSYVQPGTKVLPLSKFVQSNVKYYPFQRPMVQPIQTIQSA